MAAAMTRREVEQLVIQRQRRERPPDTEWERVVNEALRRVAGAPAERREAAINGARLMLNRALGKMVKGE
jgi:hypothetical protein